MKLLIAIILAFLAGRYIVPMDPNAKPTYGDSGLPKNCRAIIQANIDGYNSRQFSAEDALSSISRNCGMYGDGWDQR
ncbi:kynureninase [Pseudomonas typographi]|uniref:kynureninase n=1 Tax=Pseudomonas typographi TaxID=2715964 RepID=UPI001689A0CB|nr:kynureninase [Pseudomonas typographi]MBD1554761.1 kynureninase [Pseudomonas typographi]